MKRSHTALYSLVCLTMVLLAFYLTLDVQKVVYTMSARVFTLPHTVLEGLNNCTNSSMIEDFRYRTETSVDNQRRHLAAELSLYKDRSALLKLGFPLQNFTRRESPSQFVFATAANDYYFHIDMDAIARIQTLFPNTFIYFYDLSDGLLDSKVEKIRALCNVRYQKFPFANYPSHVRKLQTYAWKPIIIHELLHMHEMVFWVDSSIRFQTSNLSQVYTEALNKSRGLVTFDNSGHNIFMATHARMYRYLPITNEMAISVSMRGANAIFICRSRELYENVLKWWFLCALEPDCIAPTTDLYCKFRGRNQYGQCHRYDQSALGILLGNYFNGDDKAYSSSASVLTVERGSYDIELVSVCRVNEPVLRTKSKKYF